MDAMALQLRGVCKRYPDFALDGIDLALPRGSVMGFLGANGAGKSTTIRILLGLVRQDSGSVEVLGHPVPRRQAAAKSGIGFVSEDLRLYAGATLQWHMDLVASMYPTWSPGFAELLLRRFDLRAPRRIGGMSHGQRVKAALLLALARQPRLLILDEPTTALDPVARHEVLSQLMEVMVDEERAILFSSHNTRDVEQIADSIAFIDRGRMLGVGDLHQHVERWRRIRLDLPASLAVPAVPGLVSVSGEGRSRVLVTNAYDDGTSNACQAAGCAVQSVDTMSLEEIFVATVFQRREMAA
jgi:ABC-2 type transport system ATP-binding protein